MTFAQLLSVLRARWWSVLLVLVLTVGTTVAVSLLLPKQYTASASVVADFKPDPISSVMMGGIMSPAFMATQVDIIQSERVAQRVVRNLKLAENPQVRQQWLDETQGDGTVEQWLSALFQKQMEVKPSRDSSVITVNYKAPDPRFAAALANAFVQAYIQTVLELRVDPAKQYASFFDSRAQELLDTLKTAQSKLSEFQRVNGIVATDERIDVETARLNELSSQLVAMQALASESSSRQTQANSAQGDRLPEVLANPIVGSLKADINRGEAKLQELNTRYGDNHPQVVEAKANLAELRGRLEAETRKVTGGVTVTNRINQQREAEMRAALAAQRDKVLRMKATRDQGMSLLREVDTAQRAYEALQGRLNQTSLESQTNQSNINVLAPAVPPVDPSSPKILLNTALSLFIGTVLAIGTALMLEMLDRRVRSEEDIAVSLDLPVLGVMPNPRHKGLLRRPRVSVLEQRLLAPSTSTEGA